MTVRDATPPRLAAGGLAAASSLLGGYLLGATAMSPVVTAVATAGLALGAILLIHTLLTILHTP